MLADYLSANFPIQAKLDELGELVQRVHEKNAPQNVPPKTPKRQCVIANTQPVSEPDALVLNPRSYTGAPPKQAPNSSRGRTLKKRRIVYVAVLLCLAFVARPQNTHIPADVGTLSEGLICPMDSAIGHTIMPVETRITRPMNELIEPVRHDIQLEKVRSGEPSTRKMQKRKQRGQKSARSGVFVIRGKSY
ncbi:MAG: hypothetical protein MJE77_16145 [Proteobacteria bacterium]|nr:hypothetical protein [Pseudomonadota bacterium]